MAHGFQATRTAPATDQAGQRKQRSTTPLPRNAGVVGRHSPLRRTSMANEEQLQRLRRGVQEWNAWRDEYPEEQIDLNRADLSEAKLIEAHLSGTEISNVSFSGTFFVGIDLRLVKGLVTAKHLGPSHIDLYSVQLPQDGSALHFLRGVGVPDEWIDFYRAQMMHPIQYYSVFISYSSQDDRLARRLHADLQDHGVRCWFAPHDLRPGQLIRKGIDEDIHLH